MKITNKIYLVLVLIFGISLVIAAPQYNKLETNLISGNGSTTNIYINGSMNLTDYCYANGTNNSGVDCIPYTSRNNTFTGMNSFINLNASGTIETKNALGKINIFGATINTYYVAQNTMSILGGYNNGYLTYFTSASDYPFIFRRGNLNISSLFGTGGNILVEQSVNASKFYENGVELCLANGTNCQTSGGSSNINGTNVWLGNLSLGYNGSRGIFDIMNGQTITIGNPASASLDFLYGSGGYVDYGNCFDFSVYAYKVSGSNTVYSTSPASATGCDDGTGTQSFVINISWSAVSGATGYKIVVLQDDYVGAYGDYYIDASSTSVIDDNGDVYVYESPAVVTPTSVLTGTDLYVNTTTGRLINNRDSTLNGDVNISGQTRIEDILSIFKDYSSYTGANDLGSVLFRNANGTVKIRYDWHDTYGTWMDIRNSVGASSWIGEITYTNPSSTFFDDRLALFQVRTSPSSNGGGQFFLVTHTNTSDNFNYNVQMYENGAVTLGSYGGNDGVFTSPASKVWNRGSTAIGKGASSISAPTDGLYVAGNSVFNGTINTTRINATYINVGNITVGDIIYSNAWSWYENGDTLQLRNATNGVVYVFNNTGNVGNPQAGGSTPNDGITVKVANISDYTSYTKTYMLDNTVRTFYNLTNGNWNTSVFNMSLSANTNYSIYCNLLANTTTTTTGIQYNLSTSDTINKMGISTEFYTSQTARTADSCIGRLRGCYILGTSGVTARPVPSVYSGTIQTSTNPVYLTLNMRSEIAQNVSTQAGSYCRVEKII